MTSALVARSGVVWLDPDLAEKVPADRHARFLACLFAHNASYFVGFVGGGVQIARVWMSRRALSTSPP